MIGRKIAPVRSWRREAAHAAAAIGGVAAITAIYFRWLRVTDATTVALSYLLLILFVAALSELWVALTASVVAALALNFFFFPPLFTLNINEPQDWVAFGAFIVVSVVASHLSSLVRLRDREKELERRSAEMRAGLLASLAHDLRTPLTVMGTAISNLEQSAISDAERYRQADLSREALDRLKRLFENMLEMARLESGAATASLRWVHFGEILQAARTQVEPALRQHQLRVVDRVGERLIGVDPKLLATALAHVLENAAQYSPPSSFIVVTHDVVAHGVSISVEDAGVGIHPSDLDHIFERFYRGVRAERHRSGTGMGLAIVNALMRAQGGRVIAENRPNGGARFSLIVPAEVRSIAEESAGES